MNEPKTPPPAAPLLAAMSARKDKLEADRAEVFPKWKATLEAAGGNISRAGRLAFFDDSISFLNDDAREVAERKARDQAAWLTKRLGLVAYAAELRLAAGAGARVTFGELKGKVMGRPPGPNKRKAGSGKVGG